MNSPLFPEPKRLEFRRQFGNPNRPLWGQPFDQFNAIDRKELNQQVKDAVVLTAQGDRSISRITSDFSKAYVARGGKRGMGKKSILELMFRIGMLLNEISDAKGIE